VERWILSAPLLALFAVLVAWPIYAGIRTAFSHDVLSEFAITSAGFQNFRDVVTDQNFWHAIWFTVRFGVLVTFFELSFGFGLALLVDRVFPGKRFLISCLLIPIMIAPSLMGVMFRLLLNENVGVIPAILSKFGLHLNLFSNSSIFPLLIVLDIIQYLPFCFLLVYSVLQSFPAELLESAAVDGAGYWRIIRSIIAPVMLPTFIIVGLLRFLDALRTFDVIYILTGGGPGIQTTTTGIFIYKKAFVEGNFGAAAASALIVVLLLTPFIPAAVRRLVRN